MRVFLSFFLFQRTMIYLGNQKKIHKKKVFLDELSFPQLFVLPEKQNCPRRNEQNPSLNWGPFRVVKVGRYVQNIDVYAKYFIIGFNWLLWHSS